MHSKILIFGLIATIIIVLFFAIQKEEIKIHDVDEAIELLKQNYSMSDYSLINISNITKENVIKGWNFEFLKTDGNCSLECVETHIYFDVYRNGTIIKNAQLKNVTRIENENDALNYVLYKFPEFKKIKKCEFEEKLMCHEDITAEKINDKWNITFMNESKGCNNECVIEHYYSFIVEKNGEINKYIVDERKIEVEDTIGEGMNYEKIPKIADAIYTYMRKITGVERWHLKFPVERVFIECVPDKCLLPWDSLFVNVGKSIDTGERYVLFINKDKKNIYRINESKYNLLLEKFSTKTINNESDVLEAFERYLKLFDGRSIMEIKKLKRCIITSEDMEKDADRYIELIRYGGNGFEDRLKPKIIKKGSYWLANISVFYRSCNVSITDYEVVLSDRGAVINLTVANTTSHLFCLPPL